MNLILVSGCGGSAAFIPDSITGAQSAAALAAGATVHFTGSSAELVYPVQFLANGHFVLLIGPNSPVPIQTAPPTGSIGVLREIDLVGNTIRGLSIQELNGRLAAKGLN